MCILSQERIDDQWKQGDGQWMNQLLRIKAGLQRGMFATAGLQDFVCDDSNPPPPNQVMRYIIFLILAFSLSVLGSPLSEDVLDIQQRDSSLVESTLLAQRDGDVSLLEGRDLTEYFSSPVERDLVDEDAIHNLVLRHLEIEERDLTDLEPRYVQVIARVAQGIVKIVQLIKGQIEKDKSRRGQFTIELVGKSKSQFPGWNWVVCHTKHTTKFDGKQGTDWGHRHQEYQNHFGKGTIGYEIYYFKSGTFIRHGDGGFLNWAYIGNIKSKSKDGKTITFNKP